MAGASSSGESRWDLAAAADVAYPPGAMEAARADSGTCCIYFCGACAGVPHSGLHVAVVQRIWVGFE